MEKRTFFSKVRELNSQVEWNRLSEKETRVAESSEIILRMQGYEDIFSDFDPRHLSKRSLSDDFLSELKRASIDKNDKIELRLIINGKHDKNTEHIVRKRLKDHFSRHLQISQKEIGSLKIRGVLMTLFGALLLTAASYFDYIVGGVEGFFYKFIITLLEPAGWFTAWEGMYLILFGFTDKRKEKGFYSKMANSEIIFEH